MRRVLLVVLLVGGFWYLTSHLSFSHGDPTWNHFALFPAKGSDSPLQLTEAEAAPSFDAEEQNNIAVYKRVLPSVVNITSTTLSSTSLRESSRSTARAPASSWTRPAAYSPTTMWSRNANRGIEVTLSNKRRYNAKVIGTDKVHDLALLQIEAPNLEPVILADSRELAVGQKVYAIGNPFGLSGTMTRGIISAIRPIRVLKARPSRTPSRPMRQSTPATLADPCSTLMARSSASTP